MVQWCHGLAGMVTSLADMPETLAPDLNPLLLQMGELVWHAGPLKKGPGICHGTAGNGYGFLYLYRRTGDLKWLERARQFAMEGISQYQIHRNQYSQGRFSLWTGDIGLAIYLHHCIQPQHGAIPGLDLF